MMARFDVRIDLGFDYSFGDAGDISNSVHAMYWSLGMGGPGDVVASEASLRLTVIDSAERFRSRSAVSLTWNGEPLTWMGNQLSWSGQAAFWDQVKQGMMVRVRRNTGTDLAPSWVTLYMGWLRNIELPEHRYEHEVVLSASDKIRELQEGEYRPTLRQNVPVNEEIEAIFDDAIVQYPYTHSFWVLGRSQLGVDSKIFGNDGYVGEQSLRRLEWAGDISDSGQGSLPMGYINRVLFAEFGGRFFSDRLGKFRFQAREHDFNSVAAVSVTDSEYHDVSSQQAAVINRVFVTYYPRRVGSPDSILYQRGDHQEEGEESDEVTGVLVGSREDTELTIRFYDPNNAFATVGGLDIQDMVGGTDYHVRTEDGIDVTDRIGVVQEWSANGGSITFINPTDDDVVVTAFQVRGTPLISTQSEETTVIDEASIDEHGLQPSPRVYVQVLGDEDKAKLYGDHILERNARPRQRYVSVAFEIGGDGERDALAAKVLPVAIGDLVNVNGEEYTVIGEQHDVEGFQHSLRWNLRLPLTYPLWRLGESELGVNTTLSIG